MEYIYAPFFRLLFTYSGVYIRLLFFFNTLYEIIITSHSLPTLGQCPQMQSALPATSALGTNQPVQDQFTSPSPISQAGWFSPHTQLARLIYCWKNCEISHSLPLPPIPLKIAEAIRQGEFIDLSKLLPILSKGLNNQQC